jgi:hypothetical protein
MDRDTAANRAAAALALYSALSKVANASACWMAAGSYSGRHNRVISTRGGHSVQPTATTGYVSIAAIA